MYMLKIHILQAASSKAATINQGPVRQGVTTAYYNVLERDVTRPVGTMELLQFVNN